MHNDIQAEAVPIQQFRQFLQQQQFPCIAAKAAQSNQNVSCMMAFHLACPKDDTEILQFLYAFTDAYKSSTKNYHSAAIIFTEPHLFNEELFDVLMWQRLQALANLDAENYNYDTRVASDPSDSNFSFSLKEEAFYIIGLHPCSSRKARQFFYPTLVFNPHAQFEALRKTDKYEPIKKAIRKRDTKYSGSVNPMLQDFGQSSEALQYSGRHYNKEWQCPLKINHADKHH